MIFDSLKNARLYTELSANIKTALEFMMNNDLASMPSSRFWVGDNVEIAIKQEAGTKPVEQCKFENHQKFIDIQYLLSGKESIAYCDASCMEVKIPYDEETDKTIFHDCAHSFRMRLKPGDFLILFPDDAHMTLIAENAPAAISKAVIKVRV